MPKTNVVFGYEERTWETTTGSHMSGDRLEAHHATELDNRPDPKAVHWSFGCDFAPYSTSSLMPDPRDANAAPVRPNKGLDLKKTNFVLGHDAPSYDWKKGPSKKDVDEYTEAYVHEQRRAHANMPDSARPHKKSIVWGDDNAPLSTESRSNFVEHKLDDLAKKQGKEKIHTFVRTLKTCAVNLGTDKLDYACTNRLPGHDVTRVQLSSSASSKLEQTKSNILLGCDANTYETSSRHPL